MNRASLPALTGARFFAAVSIVIFHYGARSLSPPLVVLSKAGPAAVSFFYVLSGTVLTWGGTDEAGQPLSGAGKFWGRRARRILPVYYLALAFTLPSFAQREMVLHGGAEATFQIVIAVAACALLLQAFWPPISVGLNTPAWSLSCEAFFYALWPGVVGRLHTKKPGFPWRRTLLAWLLGLVAPVVVVLLLHARLVPGRSFWALLGDVSTGEMLSRALSYFPPLRLPEFLMGIAVGHALSATPARARSPGRDTLREAALCCVTIACAWALGAGAPERIFGVRLATRFFVEGGVLSPLLALWVWQLARGRGLLTQLLSTSALRMLGNASYALYVMQEPMFIYVTGSLKRLAPAAVARWDLAFWGYLALLILLSLAIHRFWELPFRRRSSGRK
ncbi:MAG TPA: acyltransferase [Myxococcales bacterium]|nr:acyltransferase [Myxococcales bacterium]